MVDQSLLNFSKIFDQMIHDIHDKAGGPDNTVIRWICNSLYAHIPTVLISKSHQITEDYVRRSLFVQHDHQLLDERHISHLKMA